MNSRQSEILNLIRSIKCIDTHEHLPDESTRLRFESTPSAFHPVCGLKDFSILLSHYVEDDLRSAGLDEASLKKILSPEITPQDKWKLVEPYYKAAHNSGYLLDVRLSLQALFGIDDLSADNVLDVSDKLKTLVQPGYYKKVLNEISGIDYCQVNSLEAPVFRETDLPELLTQDINIGRFCSSVSYANINFLSRTFSREIKSIEDWKELIENCFRRFGPRAIAIKNIGAYVRCMDYKKVAESEVVPLFSRLIQNDSSLSGTENKTIQDYFFHFCLDQAEKYNLPVKLHTGYYVGNNQMPLHRLRHNGGDITELLMAHPKARFVVMHDLYPFQDEAIAIAKHFTNAWIDMCWAWIINPSAGVRFLKEFLMGAPANKIFTFGGDLIPVELVPGHVEIARRGIAQALSELLEEGWLTDSQIPDLVYRLVRGNAEGFFRYQDSLDASSRPN